MVRGNALLELRMRAGFRDWHQVAVFFGYTPRSVANWQKEGAPYVVEKFLLLLAGDLSFLGDAWRDWSVVDGELLQVGGRRYTPGDIRAIPHLDAQIEHLRRDIEVLQRRLHAAEAQLRFQSVLDASMRDVHP